MSRAIPLLLFLGLVTVGDEKPPAARLLHRGEYHKIDPGTTPAERAAWAFARFHLAPERTMYAAALAAHQKGEPLGTFVLLLCHQEGRVVRRDEKALREFNAEVRKALAGKAAPTGLELYLLSQTSGGFGRLQPEQRAADEKQRRAWLERAADKGFAQAVFELGRKYQQDEKHEKAQALFDQAAASGLAAAWRTKGFCTVEGIGVKKDAEKGLAHTLAAGQRGDVFAMVSLAFYHDKGWGTKRDLKESRAWIEKAAGTGHWLGYTERAQCHLQGINGYDRNPDEAKKDIERALETRNRDVLEALALWYTNAVGVDRDGRKAVRYGEAAFVQGSTRAARILAHVYKEGVGGIEVDEKRARFWTVQADPAEALASWALLEAMFPQLVDRLSKLDPWDVR